MITCKLCGTDLNARKIRKDGSILCPVCGQIYWKAAVERASHTRNDIDLKSRIEAKYFRESQLSIENIRRARLAY